MQLLNKLLGKYCSSAGVACFVFGLVMGMASGVG